MIRTVRLFIHPRQFERAPIFFGIVIIPLAASCAFSMGAWHQGPLARRDASEQRQQTELRLLVSERERRDESEVVLSQKAAADENLRLQLHTLNDTPPPFLALDCSRRCLTVAVLPQPPPSGQPGGPLHFCAPARGPPSS